MIRARVFFFIITNDLSMKCRPDVGTQIRSCFDPPVAPTHAAYHAAIHARGLKPGTFLHYRTMKIEIE